MNFDDENKYKSRKSYIICDILMHIFPDMKLNVIDVGADFFKNRHHWHQFDPSRLKIHVFDIDKKYNTAEAELDQRGISWHFYPYAVSDREGTVSVYLPENPINGSCFLPNEEMLQFGSYDGQPWTICPIKTVAELPAISLDVWKNRYNIGPSDILKMNIQGAELAALRGGTSVLGDVIAIEIEMSLSQTYLFAPLFSDIDPVLRQNGFEFFDMLGPNVCSFRDTPVRFGESRNLQAWGFPRHKIFEGHFLYFRDPFAYSENRLLPAEKLLKLACIAEVYGHVEYSFALLNWLQNTRPELRTELSQVIAESADLYQRSFGGESGR